MMQKKEKIYKRKHAVTTRQAEQCYFEMSTKIKIGVNNVEQGKQREREREKHAKG